MTKQYLIGSLCAWRRDRWHSQSQSFLVVYPVGLVFLIMFVHVRLETPNSWKKTSGFHVDQSSWDHWAGLWVGLPTCDHHFAASLVLFLHDQEPVAWMFKTQRCLNHLKP